MYAVSGHNTERGIRARAAPRLKRPWFHIIDVIEPRGRSMEDIAAEVARERGVTVVAMRSPRFTIPVFEARCEAMTRISAERPDLVSEQVGRYFNRDGSIVRRIWRQAA